MAAAGLLVILIFFMMQFTLMAIYASRVRKVGPNEVMIISGRAQRNLETGEIQRFRIVQGGRAFIWPVLERVDTLSLEVMPVDVSVKNVHTAQGDKVTLRGRAQIKIDNDPDSVVVAAEHMLSKSRDEIIDLARELIEEELRTVVSAHSTDDMTRFTSETQQALESKLSGLGLHLVAFSIKTAAN